jgi:hypothetical protein
MSQVELLFFPDCPHVQAARTQLERAFAALGQKPEWIEWDVTSPDSPADVQSYGSPTIRVDGHDVTGAAPSGSAACRLYTGSEVAGAPPLALIVAALKRR